ncbi:hypothetical protein HYDPIDRAFT_31913 [Hydnomerulius pinastri MD-312]|uniref:F-box domain-containing protein n=1 Tax=Hydnomerulius pinastri MD-312 TaxID=994086 RepID=A0A0C9WBI6_9AGAM|nr:hypothetical protein HYDPIDRAFT_31913 [Hydnomerulius pinastri MD-312]
MLLIFRLACNSASDSRGLLPAVTRPSPSLFPFNLAAVCSDWRSILSKIPEFWRRLVIVVDSNQKPVATFKTLLTWSQDLPLDISIFTTHDELESDTPHGDATEASHVDTLMKHLVPELHRCTRIYINTIYTSSLPSFSDIFGARPVGAPLLSELTLHALTGQEPGKGAPRVSEPVLLSFPSLTSLDIDGANFRRHWFDLPPERSVPVISPQLRHVSISNYDAGMPMRSMFQTLKSIARLQVLSLKNIQFDNTMIEKDSVYLPRLRSLWLAGLSPGAALMIFSALETSYIADITIERSHINFIDGAGIECGSLSLIDIEDGQDLHWVLKDWLGDTLSVTRCPGFNDTIIRGIMGFGAFDSFLCRYLCDLRIKDCMNFSPSILRQMHHVRKRIAADDQVWSDEQVQFTFVPTCRTIKSLSIVGGRPEFSPGDQAWLDGFSSGPD